MHELSVCHALIAQVESIVRQHHAQGVRTIRLRIGPLCGVDPDLMVHAFPLARAGTLAEGADLVIERLPIRVRCGQCGAESEAAANRLLCAHCGDWHTQIISGDEMLLENLELETDGQPQQSSGAQ